VAIIYPAHLKNMTAGAWRQVKQQGSTTASGGWHSMDRIHKVATDTSLYLQPNEPLGEYMTALKAAIEDSKEMTEALLKNTNSMVEQARETNKQLNDVSGKMRDGAEKLGSAIEKFNKIAGNTNFAETARQAESLVNSLERLAVLEASGTLDKVMKAMSK
jgi:ABC-type transporter Mla subunit MlaD